jgi:hypothetical protein
MLAQSMAVAVIVAACTVYAVWRLMPSVARRRVAVVALRLPLPVRFAAPLRRMAQATNACGCDGCDGDVARPAAGAPQRVTFHPRRRP